MVVQHNLQAMNANRMLGTMTSAQSKSTEKLSSGYKINRAADDAAGLSISEKMRKQMRGLDQASSNAEDGISAVQTAEGALTEVHSMLQRMNELAVQAANGTNSTSDRQSIQDEIDQLTTEIDRVAETTKFNETFLLKGGTGTKEEKLDAYDAGLAGKLGTYTDTDATVKFTADALVSGSTVTIAGIEYTIADTADVDNNILDTDTAYTKMAEALLDANRIGNTNAEVSNDGDGVFTITRGTVTIPKALSFNLHVGSDADMTNKIGVNIETMSSAFLGIEGISVVGANDAAPGTQATYAIDAVANALQKVSEQRSALGAVQNRLEHTVSNLDNVVENTTASESRIRDTDMAEEMVEYSKNNILMQAGQSMLAQANTSTQGVLSLLQG